MIAISVVIYQARRQRRLRQKNPEVVQVRSSRRHSSKRHSGKKVAKDLESGPEQPIEITNPGKVENDGYIDDDDDDGNEEQPEDRKVCFGYSILSLGTSFSLKPFICVPSRNEVPHRSSLRRSLVDRRNIRRQSPPNPPLLTRSIRRKTHRDTTGATDNLRQRFLDLLTCALFPDRLSELSFYPPTIPFIIVVLKSRTPRFTVLLYLLTVLS